MSKPVALILLNWNTPAHTANCILSLLQYCDEQLFDIIVADNGSTDNSLALLKAQFPNLIYIDNKENLGFAEGNNKGLVYSINNCYTYSLVMNTDTLVDEDLVTGLKTHLDNYSHAAAVQPAIYWMHDRTRIWNGEGSFNSLLGVTRSSTETPDSNTYKIVEWVTGCCMMIRNSALIMSGLFNKQFFLYYEDVELSFRLRDLGYELHYLPACKMYHEAGVSAKVEKKEGFLSPVIHYYISRNHIWFLRRYALTAYYPVNLIYNGFYYLALLAYFILRGRKEKARLLMKGLKEGIFTPGDQIWSPTNSSIR
ncbi:glycosyltransferase family 2 protein [Mucilaginibacter corticis]|uniref:Glycosyltransferase family 2 protein n=1 Tax=Mucilaginibacter corticis TaxID=2597670 RepID=A0A556MK80_9SPHI|nr:glycosyltransferase family 2 protein [Mucilaginibacter corticis]TSJ40318.1 glycosyltransferase family 2 protein [Mucilaginibacter corticis]